MWKNTIKNMGGNKMSKEYKWEQTDGSYLTVIVDRENGTVVAKDKHGNIRMNEKGLNKKQLEIIESQFLDVVTDPEKFNKPSKEFNPMYA